MEGLQLRSPRRSVRQDQQRNAPPTKAQQAAASIAAKRGNSVQPDNPWEGIGCRGTGVFEPGKSTVGSGKTYTGVGFSSGSFKQDSDSALMNAVKKDSITVSDQQAQPKKKKKKKEKFGARPSIDKKPLKTKTTTNASVQKKPNTTDFFK